MAPAPTILQEIARHKQQEITAYYQQHSLESLRQQVVPGTRKFHNLTTRNRQLGRKFFIAECKRRSPSNPGIAPTADPLIQVASYLDQGADAISVLTDNRYFGGQFEDMLQVQQLVGAGPVAILNKDFILDPIQIYLARKYGADLILLIAALLSDEELLSYHTLATSLGMDTITEVHTREERDRAVRLGLPVIGVNNRDLHSFKISLNTTNFLAYDLPKDRIVIAESGMDQPIDFRICGPYADGFLVGTSLMQGSQKIEKLQDLLQQRYFFKACGLRTAEQLDYPGPDLQGINFSPKSRRTMPASELKKAKLSAKSVALFFQNSPEEMRNLLSQSAFRWVQTYGDMPVDLVQASKKKWIYAFRQPDTHYADYLHKYPADLFILDGAVPGSGQSRGYSIPDDFPFPFLLAGGITQDTLQQVQEHPLCIGVDMASGIEKEGSPDKELIRNIAEKLHGLP
jgi:indole-3-glycerol phosphate synthase/phosphoribosylanthranilate isomerase